MCGQHRSIDERALRSTSHDERPNVLRTVRVDDCPPKWRSERCGHRHLAIHTQFRYPMPRPQTLHDSQWPFRLRLTIRESFRSPCFAVPFPAIRVRSPAFDRVSIDQTRAEDVRRRTQSTIHRQTSVPTAISPTGATVKPTSACACSTSVMHRQLPETIVITEYPPRLHTTLSRSDRQRGPQHFLGYIHHIAGISQERCNRQTAALMTAVYIHIPE